jgi:hypothetical protein
MTPGTIPQQELLTYHPRRRRIASRIMKLAGEFFKLQSTEVAGFHTRALRVIGHLADLFPEFLEIERQGENFVVQGQCARSRLESKAPSSGWNSLKEFLNRDVTTLAGETKIQSVAFDRTYNPNDILQLEEFGIRHRAGLKKSPTFALSVKSCARSVDLSMVRTVG